jgi:hypothetical protein
VLAVAAWTEPVSRSSRKEPGRFRSVQLIAVLPHCSILSLFYLVFVHLFALSRQASYRLPFARDRPINMIHPKLLRLTEAVGEVVAISSWVAFSSSPSAVSVLMRRVDLRVPFLALAFFAPAFFGGHDLGRLVTLVERFDRSGSWALT